MEYQISSWISKENPPETSKRPCEHPPQESWILEESIKTRRRRWSLLPPPSFLLGSSARLSPLPSRPQAESLENQTRQRAVASPMNPRPIPRTNLLIAFEWSFKGIHKTCRENLNENLRKSRQGAVVIADLIPAQFHPPPSPPSPLTNESFDRL